MEKRKPHHDLASFQRACSAPDKLRATRTALKDAQALGLTRAMMVDAIQSMQRRHFYKSMTAFADHRQWQDVYHVPWKERVLYVKFTDDRVTAFRLLSFKEK